MTAFKLKSFGIVLLVMVCLATESLRAQGGSDFSNVTLNFQDVTQTRINQTVSESSDNEKEVEFGDYDNDGDLDVVIAVALSDFGQRRNKLYRNDEGVLNEVSGAPVISGFNFTDTSRSAFFRDFNNDGFLDIIIVNDSNSGTANNDSPGKTKFYRNVDGMSFVNESERLSGQTGSACNGSAADFDGNGFCDLFMCNYAAVSQDALGLNNFGGLGPGQFSVATSTHFPAESFYGVHSETADMNGDGKLDILVANWAGSSSFIYYNDNDITDGVDQNTSSGLGDFRYEAAGAFTSFAAAGGTSERALVPADFNGDGRMDFFFGNAGGFGSSRSDAIYINTGNDTHNRAEFSAQAISMDLNDETMKATCNDLDGDGRVDIVVMSENRRPHIFRNTSENGVVSFVEWTPAMLTNLHRGWQANSTDLTGNGRPDLLVGANNNDFLFENVSLDLFDFESLDSGLLPSFHNLEPIAVSGCLASGDTHTLISVDGGTGIPAGARVSALLRSTADLSLEVSIDGVNVASSSRPGDAVDEAVQFVTPFSGSVSFVITNKDPGDVLLGDVNRDGSVDLLDVAPFVQLLIDGQFDKAADFDGNGVVDLLDIQPFIDVLSGGGGSKEAPYLIEILSRSNE